MMKRRDFVRRTFLAGSGLWLPTGRAAQGTKRIPELDRHRSFVPGYRKLEESGELEERIRELKNLYKSCCLCPRMSKVNRLRGEKDVCQATARLRVAAAYPHFGEESILVGKRGSGTIFLSHCSLRCVFCINSEISWQGRGEDISVEDMARLMLMLQARGCRNINLVTPTHYIPGIVEALRLACRGGLRIPLVYNTSGYDRVNVVKLLEGIVDIYMPDLKFFKAETSARLCSGAGDYFASASAAVLEMHRQVGDVVTDADGNALRGLMIRHLVMPNNVSDTDILLAWIADNLPRSTYLNLMAQYRPSFRASEFPEIARPLTRKEFQRAVDWARENRLTNLDPRS